MTITVVGLKKQKRKYADFLKNVSKNFSKELKMDIADKIIEVILSGRSPVKGKQFRQYAKSYEKIKGRRKPVDLLVSGQMLNSIRVFQKRDKKGTLMVKFTDKLAVIHDKKGIKRKDGKVIRRLLPRRGEVFKAEIQNYILKILKKAVKKSVNKANK